MTPPRAPRPDPLAELLLTPEPVRAIGLVTAAIMTAYDVATGRNVVTDGAVTWSDLPVAGVGGYPALAPGRVILLRTSAKPIILCNLYSPEAI